MENHRQNHTENETENGIAERLCNMLTAVPYSPPKRERFYIRFGYAIYSKMMYFDFVQQPKESYRFTV